MDIANLNPQTPSEELSNQPSASQVASGDFGKAPVHPFNDGGWNSTNYLDKMIQRANDGDEAAIQFLANYFASEESARTARDWTAQREDSAYQRLAEDLKKAGISPYVMSGATPMVSSSQGRTYSGSGFVSQQSNEKTTQTSRQNQQEENVINVVRSILQIVGVVAGALMYTLI